MNSINRWMALVCLGVGIICSLRVAVAQPLPPHSTTLEYVPGMVVVKFRPGFSIGSAQAVNLFADIGITSSAQVFPATKSPSKAKNPKTPLPAVDLSNIYLLSLKNQNMDPVILSDYIARLSFVEWAEPNYLVELGYLPLDHYYSETSIPGSWNQPYEDLWRLKIVEPEDAWEIATGTGTVIAPIDTGADYTHPDLADNIWINVGEDQPPLGMVGPEDINGFDDDSNGYIDDIRGMDFAHGNTIGLPNDNDPMDYRDHGTAVAGIAAALTDTQGILGLAFDAKIMLVKGYTDCYVPCGQPCPAPNASSTDLAEGIKYATDNGADIISMSWGSLRVSNNTIKDAIKYAYSQGAVLVAIAHNQGYSIELNNVTPARWPWPITVGGSNEYDRWWEYSNYGTSLDIVAPAGGLVSDTSENSNILSSISTVGRTIGCSSLYVVGSSWGRAYGTSLAAPLVAGLAGLVQSHHPGFSNEQTRQVIEVSAEDIVDPLGTGQNFPGFDVYTGYGRANAYRAVCDDPADVLCDLNPVRDKVATPQEALIISPLNGDIVNGLVNIYGIAKGPQFSSYTLEYGSGIYPASWSTIAVSSTPSPDPSPVDGSLLESLNMDLLSSGDYTFRLTVASTLGHSYSDRVKVSLARPLHGFPTNDLSDGKMVTVVGQQLSTISVPQITFFIGVDSAESNFSVDLFDADMGANPGFGVPVGWSFGDGCNANPTINKTFYNLYADPLKDGSGTFLAAQISEDPWVPPATDGILDQALTSLYSGPVHPEAQAPSGNYFYRLEVILGPDANTPDPSVPCVNGFKVLTTGQIGITFGNLQFMGFDAVGPYRPVGGGSLTPPSWCPSVSRPVRNPAFSWGVDTNYDGKFSFYFFVPSTTTSFTLIDADADSLCDGCVDQDASNPSAPGWAQGETYRIAYAIFNPKGEWLSIQKMVGGIPRTWTYNWDVSGSYDPSRNDFDLETATALCGGSCVSGYYNWIWFNVLSENNIHIRPPASSIYELTSERFPWLSVTSAKSLGFYKQLSDQKISELLPQILGQLDTAGYPIGISLIVSEVSLAKEIMAKKGPRISSYSHPIRNLLTQLLIAKFNLLRAEDFNEPLEEAFVLGTDFSVGEAVESSDALIALIECPNCPLPNDLAQEIDQDTKFLDLINNGMVLYSPPPALSPNILKSQSPDSTLFHPTPPGQPDL